jgi:hypothetical protein
MSNLLYFHDGISARERASIRRGITNRKKSLAAAIQNGLHSLPTTGLDGFTAGTLQIFDSDERGVGVKTLVDIAKDTWIIATRGELHRNSSDLSPTEAHFTFDGATTSARYCLVLSNPVKSNIVRFIKNAQDCSANVTSFWVTDYLLVFKSARAIAAGEELLGAFDPPRTALDVLVDVAVAALESARDQRDEECAWLQAV